MGIDQLARTAVGLAAVGVLVSSAGLVVAALGRSGDDAVGVALLVAGTALCVASAGVGVAAGREPAGLIRPAGVTGSWPGWPWWWAVGAAGVLDILGGPVAAGWVGVAGVVLLAVGLGGLGRELVTPTAPVHRRVVQVARRLRDAAAGAPDPQVAIAPIGALGARVVMFDRSGRLADVVVRDPVSAELAAQLAGVRVVSPAELHPPVRTGTPADPDAR